MNFYKVLLTISLLFIFTIYTKAQDNSTDTKKKLPTQFNHSDDDQNNQNGDSKLPTQFNHTDEQPGTHQARDPFEKYSGSGTYYFTFLSDNYIDGSNEATRMDGSKYYYFNWSCYSVSHSEADNAASLESSTKGYSSYFYTKFVSDK